jgi:crotonobetainyl-CoA:carnitine CoA-transferase CaiB-like acyl-CoA transferase
VVVENFTPDVLRKYNLHYEALAAIKPDLVMASVSVAGQHGPYRDTRAYAFNLHALSGLCSLIGYEGDTVPRHIDIAYADWNAGMFATYAILLALYHRRRTGAGQFIDLSAWESTTTLLTEGVLDYTLNQRVPGPQDNLHPAMAPHGYYPCQGEDAWLALSIRSDAEWHNLCNVMGQPQLAHEPRFHDAYQRLAHRQELDQLVAAWTRTHSAELLTRRLQAAGMAAMPLCTVEGRFHNAHLRARQTHVEVYHPRLGTELLHTIPWHLSATPPSVRGPAPLVGEHNAYVLGELLGLSPAEQQQLAQEGVPY